jgi:hypothetical protein
MIMSKKTLALVVALTVLTLILVVLALNTGQKATPGTPKGQASDTPTPTAPRHTTIDLSPDPVTFVNGTATVNVDIDTSDNPVTGAQFELTYDSDVLNFKSIQPGDFFTNPLVILNDSKTPGKIKYMISLTPAQAQAPKTGTGSIATITFTRKSTAPRTGTTPLKFTENEVIVSAKDITDTVLKSATGTVIDLSSSTSVTPSPTGR